MNDGERYRKDFDLIFQEMEEKETLQRQSIVNDRAAFLDGLPSSPVREGR
jgi:hypothetical protein